MKKLFLTTAIITLGALASGSFAFADSVETLTQQEFVQIQENIKTCSVATGLYNGDFQSIAKTLKQNGLYDGVGSGLMISIRFNRY